MPSPKFWKELQEILAKHNKRTARGNHVASFETQHKRAEILDQGFRDLWKRGYHLGSPRSFCEKHMKALGHHWEEKGYKDVQTRMSVFRVFGNEWLGKTNMIKASVVYVSNPDSVKRKYVTNEDKTWTGKGIDVLAKIKEVADDDERVGLVLELCLSFGVRLKEALLMRPHQSYKEAYVDVNRGTKGGRDRTVSIEEVLQKDVLERACLMLSRFSSSMIPDRVSYDSYRDHVYYICRKHAITRRQLGIVPHGLRHEYACVWFEKKTGIKPPIKDRGAVLPKEQDDQARRELAENLGHSRKSIVGCYVGSRNVGSCAPPSTGNPAATHAKPKQPSVPAITKRDADALWRLLLIGRKQDPAAIRH